MAINKVCQSIHKRMYGLDAASNTSKNFKYVNINMFNIFHCDSCLSQQALIAAIGLNVHVSLWFMFTFSPLCIYLFCMIYDFSLYLVQINIIMININILRLILVKAICKNKEFNAKFNRYYKSVQRRSDELARIKRHIRKTQRKNQKIQRKRARSNAAAYDHNNATNAASEDISDAPETPKISTSKSSPITLNPSTLTLPKKRMSIC